MMVWSSHSSLSQWWRFCNKYRVGYFSCQMAARHWSKWISPDHCQMWISWCYQGEGVSWDGVKGKSLFTRQLETFGKGHLGEAWENHFENQIGIYDTGFLCLWASGIFVFLRNTHLKTFIMSWKGKCSRYRDNILSLGHALMQWEEIFELLHGGLHALMGKPQKKVRGSKCLEGFLLLIWANQGRKCG